MRIVVVGSINMDVVARVPRVPAPGETLLATGSFRGGGGKGANQVIAVARAGGADAAFVGADAAFVGAVGDDPDGQALRAALVRDGIDVTGLAVRPGTPSGAALISVAEDGENAIVVVPGANAGLTELTPRQCDVVATADAVVAQLEIPVAGVLQAAGARAPHAPLVLNASPSAALAVSRPGAQDAVPIAADVDRMREGAA